MITNIRSLLELHEGRVPYAYQDSLGFWTIGVGHLIDKRKGGALPPQIIEALLSYDIATHQNLLIGALPWVVNLDEVRYAVMVDMTFNLGVEPFDHDGFKDWPMFVEQVRTGQFAAAAVNMRSTLWAQQVKIRAVRLSKMMESGKWPTE